MKIIRFSDVHLDMDYIEGSDGDCGLPICCRDGNGSTDPAGVYGHFHCGLPVKGFEEMLKHAKENHGVSFDFHYICHKNDSTPSLPIARVSCLLRHLHSI